MHGYQIAGILKVIRDKIVEKGTDHAFDALIKWPFAVAFGGAVFAALSAFLRRSFTLDGWQLSLLIASIVALARLGGALA
jgi:hypothetical protein